MDSEAIRKKRQEDIEAKRRRLEEMRRSRQESAASVAPPAPTPVTPPSVAETAPQSVKSEAEVTEELVQSLLKEPTNVDKPATEASSGPTKSKEALLREKIESFSTVKSFNIIDILPVAKEVYDKGTQMEEEDLLFLNATEGAADRDFVPEPESQAVDDEEEETESTPMKAVGSPGLSKALFSNGKTPRQGRGGCATLEIEAQFAEKATVKLSEEEREKITAAKGFQNFLRMSSLYVERALALTEEHDVLRDFSVDEKGNTGDLDEHSAFIPPAVGASAAAPHSSAVYEDDHVAGRPVMDLRWSHLVPELFLAAYGAKPAPSATAKGGVSSRAAGGEEEAPGLLCVWGKDLHGRPEYRFTASSPVLAAVFHSHEQHLVLGGCYSGQILLWDMKLNKALPVQRSSMSGKGHKHPVYAMAMTSSAVAAELVSVSTEGLLCHWDVNRLTEPITVVQLHLPALSAGSLPSLGMGGLLSPIRDSALASSATAAAQSPLNISAMAFGHSASDHSSGAAGDAVGAADLIFGCGSGQLVRTPLPYRDNHPNAAKVDAHYGFITAIEPHPSRSNKYKHLLLSSSLDWTVKLWDLKDFTQPIFEFFAPSYDYVCDVQWSPAHPAVFVTVTSGGRISLWNLARSVTEPMDSLSLAAETEDGAAPGGAATGAARGEGAAGGAGAGGVVGASARALNKVVWARDGLSVLCGDSQGTLHLLKLHPSAVQTSPQEESRFESAIVSRAADQSHAADESKFASPTESAELTPKRAGGAVNAAVAGGRAGVKAEDADFTLE